MLEVSEVSAAYGSIEVLHNISLVVETGKITTLIGANGAGKTTTLKCVCGLLAPFRGQIRWKGENLVGLRPDEIVRRGVCLVPEGRHVFPHMTVAENLDMGAYQRRDRQGIARDLEWVFGLFPVLRTRRRQPAGTLSGGEQ
ncbi:MAG TPA: ATP-binding cassette domain-containing protein, partial [Firmicutes bacterium]|nr:ATP-binding cassette domain-containing protein [Bacillota bacterium]